MRRCILTAAALTLAGCGSAEEGTDPATRASSAAPALPAAGPNLAECPAREVVDPGVRPRSTAISVPAGLRGTMRADRDNIAVSTFAGTTVCVDASWMNSIEEVALSADNRFVSFSWDGYEAFGHVIVDRSGKGSIFDTGVPPVASPSGKLLAAADLSESSFGALSAFAVWRIEPAGLREIGKDEVSPPAVDWRIERWIGEDCLDLTATALADLTYPTAVDNPERRPFRAQRAGGWQLEPGSCPSP